MSELIPAALDESGRGPGSFLVEKTIVGAMALSREAC